jgi:3-methyladenine DNA glycosylase AlkC
MDSNISDHSNSTSKSDDKKAVEVLKSNAQTQEKDSFVKLAMRNMVKKGSTSLFHFFLTIVGVFGVLIGLAVAFH